MGTGCPHFPGDYAGNPAREPATSSQTSAHVRVTGAWQRRRQELDSSSRRSTSLSRRDGCRWRRGVRPRRRGRPVGPGVRVAANDAFHDLTNEASGNWSAPIPTRTFARSTEQHTEIVSAAVARYAVSRRRWYKARDRGGVHHVVAREGPDGPDEARVSSRCGPQTRAGPARPSTPGRRIWGSDSESEPMIGRVQDATDASSSRYARAEFVIRRRFLLYER
jgi:hypothetical protein